MRIVTWNVNGIRSILRKTFHEAMERIQPDIICLQETKAHPEQVELDLPGFHLYWHSAEKKGYSGTATFSRPEPLSVCRGLDPHIGDNEGRVLTTEYDDFFLVNIYTPNAKRDLARLSYRFEQWDCAFLDYLKGLEKTKPVVFCGDLNVAHQEIDLANPRGNRGNAGFTKEEREGFDNILASGFVDIFRQRNPEPGHYTWWSNFGRAREKNIGWRIDYFLLSESLVNRVKDVYILPDVMGSDHCPVVLELD